MTTDRTGLRGALEDYAGRLWYGAPKPTPWLALSALYRLLLGARWRRPGAAPGCPVIVVGNLTVGGTGKTPVVMALVRALQQAGHRVAVISRGYGGRVRCGPERVERDADPWRVGDEPALLASSLQAPVWIGRQRDQALAAALAQGAEVVVADDGLQHRALARSFEIVVVDGQRGFGNGRLLPAGPLRGPIERLKQADQLLVRAPRRLAGLPPGPEFTLEPLSLLALDGRRRAPDSLAGQTVTAVCGIAHPAQFKAQLEALGMRVDLRAFPDHYRFRAADLDGLSGPIVTTAKDAVKLRCLERLPGSIEVLEIEAMLPPELIAAVLAHVREFQGASEQ